LIIVAKFGKVFGVKGHILVHSFFSRKFDILNYKQFFLEKKVPINLTIFKKNEKLIASVSSKKIPEKINKFVGKHLYILNDTLPKLKKKQFYFNDLEKMSACVNDNVVGYVKKVNNHGAGDYLEIKKNKDELLVPFNKDHILKVDLEKKLIYLNPIYYEI